MRARHGDLEVCPKCNGTGSRVYWANGYAWSVLCFFTGYETRGQRSLLPAPTPARGRKPAKTGNRRHTKN